MVRPRAIRMAEVRSAVLQLRLAKEVARAAEERVLGLRARLGAGAACELPCRGACLFGRECPNGKCAVGA